MDGNCDRLTKELASAEFRHGVAQGFWELVDRQNDTVFVWAYAPDNRRYMMRLYCDQYDSEPIGGRFVDPIDHQVKPQAWPDGNVAFEQWVKFRPGAENFICWDQDRYGIAHHADWKGLKKWEKEANKLVAYLNFIRQMLWLRDRGYNRRQT
jgi:hypothetical protein